MRLGRCQDQIRFETSQGPRSGPAGVTSIADVQAELWVVDPLVPPVTASQCGPATKNPTCHSRQLLTLSETHGSPTGSGSGSGSGSGGPTLMRTPYCGTRSMCSMHMQRPAGPWSLVHGPWSMDASSSDLHPKKVSRQL